MTPSFPRSIIAGVAIAGALLVGGACSGDSSGGSDDSVDFASVQLSPLGDAPKLQLGEPTDKPMVVNMWATWCVPCRKEMPDFENVAGEHRSSVRFVGVNLGDTESAAAKFVAETGVTFDQYLDPDMTAQAALSIVNMPSTVLLRADGTIATTHSSALDATELRRLLRDELGIGD